MVYNQTCVTTALHKLSHQRQIPGGSNGRDGSTMSSFQSDAVTNTTSLLFETNQMHWRSMQTGLW